MRSACAVLSLSVWLLFSTGCAKKDAWRPLFDGQSLAGWKANENEGSFRVENGSIVAGGPRSHLFYVGEGSDFRNFELQAEVMAMPGSNSGIYFHTQFQEKGWPAQGFEVQVSNTHVGEGDYRENKKTGSLYGVRNVYKQLFRDNEWVRMQIAVRGKQVQIRANDILLVDYTQPDTPALKDGPALGHGTFALQGHDPKSKVHFRNIMVRELPDDGAPQVAEKPVVDDNYREILRLARDNFPVVDYHVHLKGGLTMEEALKESRRLGIQYGIAVNCGLGFPVTNDAAALEFLKSVEGQPVYIAMQGEGREWVKLFSKETIAKFDYVFTDAMTFTDDSGKRMRIWIKDEVGEIKNPQAFMDMYVRRIESVLNNEPIDIYVNATFLPDVIAADYDTLWTPARMKKVVEAAKKNDVAVEINNRYKIPNAAFIRMAKEAGVKFTCGTNNGERELGRMEYCLEMVKEAGLTWKDMWTPRPAGEKPVEKRGLPKS